ncbi:MAG: D-alanine--D-alanine ligase [Flavobacteriaceae bacterium]|nr:D-alanine--D-alanine ligase [Flavobacteriaceae bacterium]
MKNIAIVMGGYSSEVEISIKSGNVVCKNIDKTKYIPYMVHILAEKWVVIVNETEYLINKHDFSVIIKGTKINFDLVFNAIHGTPGEDGKLLAYLELLGIKHTSAPFYQMAVTFNKRDCLSIAKNYGISVAKSFYINKGDKFDKEEIIKTVGLPCFVKPNRAGSSFGISKVYEIKNLDKAIEKAFKEDSEVLIESFLDGMEVSVGVINYKNKTIVLPITEVVSENDFFDYDAKYLGQSDEITPARLTPIQKKNIEQTALKIYQKLNMTGLSRSEYILINDIPHFIEMNTVPGLTEESIIPLQVKTKGISLSDLFNDMVNSCL